MENYVLKVINEMLATIGETPLNELDARHPHVASGLNIMEFKSRELQVNEGKGWWFNQIRRIELKQNIEGKVAVPRDLLQYTTDYPDRFGQVKGYLWDNLNDTDIIGKNVVVYATRYMDYDDLPVLMQTVLAYRAIKQFAKNFDGDINKVAIVKDEADNAWTSLRIQNIREQRANTQRNPQVAAALSLFHRSTVTQRSFF